MEEDLLKGLVLDALVVVEEGGFDLLLRDLAELSGVAGSSGFVLDVSAQSRSSVAKETK